MESDLFRLHPSGFPAECEKSEWLESTHLRLSLGKSQSGDGIHSGFSFLTYSRAIHRGLAKSGVVMRAQWQLREFKLHDPRSTDPSLAMMRGCTIAVECGKHFDFGLFLSVECVSVWGKYYLWGSKTQRNVAQERCTGLTFLRTGRWPISQGTLKDASFYFFFFFFFFNWWSAPRFQSWTS